MRSVLNSTWDFFLRSGILYKDNRLILKKGERRKKKEERRKEKGRRKESVWILTLVWVQFGMVGDCCHGCMMGWDGR